MSLGAFIKDPDAILDYLIDWSSWLTSPEQIASVVWTVPVGLTSVHEAMSGTVASIWLSGGEDNTSYDVSCKITTDSVPPRTDERTFTIKVRQQ